ncbi:IclR family transcriptional regulator C-terminal domain-containing protein [Nonomuraea sp. NPDC050451]|uniref:IclR family transcriptional regulator domain-containing protein n=1 Tax=Nonomuraea sp. NPDC050451 TaxID=3364364 RepID=UPI00378C10DF
MTANPPQTASASSLRTALRIVNTVLERETSGRSGFNVARLAHEVGIDPSKASRITQELCDRGLLERREDATLRVAAEFFALARALDHGLLGGSRPILRRLAIEHGASARLSVRDGVLVRLLRAESAPEQWPARTSLVTPCWCTGAGRALLLDHTRDEIAALLADYELIGVGGPNAAHSAEELVAANDRDRPDGMVAAHGEFEHGITEYAVPVRDGGGRICASVALLGRQPDLMPRAETIRAGLTAAAAALEELVSS